MSEDGSDREVAWLVLVTAGLVEIIYMAALEKSNTFTRPMWTALFIIGVIVSMAGVAYAIRSIPLGTAYAVWTGLGAVGVIACGALFFGEKVSALQLGFMALTVVGVVGMKLAASS